MILEDLRNTDFSDLGSAPGAVRYILLSVLLVLILVAGYFLIIDDKKKVLEQTRQQELALIADFEFKQQKAANLEAYEKQLTEMQDLLPVTEVDVILALMEYLLLMVTVQVVVISGL